MQTTAFRQLTWTSWREIIRDPVIAILSIAFPLFFTVMFLFLPDVSPAPGAPKIDALQFGLPAVLLMAFMSLATTGTAAPLTVFRQKGVLRALACTPVRKSTFVLAQLPARVLIAAAELVLVALVAAVAGVLHVADPALLALGLVLSLAALLSLGYFLGGLSASPELAGMMFALLTPLLLMLSGVFLPLAMFPAWLQRAAEWLPFTYMGDLLRHGLTGTGLQFPVWQTVLVLGATFAVLTALTFRTFRWDDGEA